MPTASNCFDALTYLHTHVRIVGIFFVKPYILSQSGVQGATGGTDRSRAVEQEDPKISTNRRVADPETTSGHLLDGRASFMEILTNFSNAMPLDSNRHLERAWGIVQASGLL